jgi:hypothetical protein
LKGFEMEQYEHLLNVLTDKFPDLEIEVKSYLVDSQVIFKIENKSKHEMTELWPDYSGVPSEVGQWKYKEFTVDGNGNLLTYVWQKKHFWQK